MLNRDNLIEQLENLEESELIAAWNTMCGNCNAHDDVIFSMDEFEDTFCDTDKFELVRMALYGKFNPADDWFGFNGYGNLVSFGYEERLLDRICIGDIADDAIENSLDYWMLDITEEEEKEEETVV